MYIQDVTNQPIFSENISVKRLTTEEIITIKQNSLTITDTDGLENRNEIRFNNDLTLINIMDTDSGIAFFRTNDQTIKEFGEEDYYDLKIIGITAGMASDITVNGDLLLSGDPTIINLNGYTLTIEGDIDDQNNGRINVGSGTLVVKGNISLTTLDAGSLVNTPTWTVIGVSDDALIFNGTTQYVGCVFR